MIRKEKKSTHINLKVVTDQKYIYAQKYNFIFLYKSIFLELLRANLYSVIKIYIKKTEM